MKKSITLSISNSDIFVSLAVKTVEEACRLQKLEGSDLQAILQAAAELVTNAVHHAYPPGMEGLIDVEVLFQPHGISVTVHDMGFPFNYDRYLRSENTGGLKRIAAYVDELRFSNLGKNGKAFTVFKSHPLEFLESGPAPYSDLEDNSPASMKPASIRIRDFCDGDGESVSRLIYSNYSYSYFKAIFYYPQKIRELNESGEIASVVAETKEGKIVGHFALIRVPDSEIAEVGVAVVHPGYKGKGIMNAMLDRIMERARELKLYAVFGEALMMHPFSQRANLRHGFGESAFILGLVPATMSLTDPNAVHSDKRNGVLVGFRILREAKTRGVNVPEKYAALIERIYVNNGLKPERPPGYLPEEESRVSHEYSPYNQSGTLVVEKGGAGLRQRIHHHLHRLYRKHADMIYADINLMQVSEIDRAVALLNEEGFVFSGVIFYRRGEDDYLRLQRINTDNVELERLVCHSDFCHELVESVRRELKESEELPR